MELAQDCVMALELTLKLQNVFIFIQDNSFLG
jgi:hypothetical protein